MYINDTAKLKDGVRVLNFTNVLPSNIDNSYSFCFGYIFNTLYIGDTHHAQIMNYIMEEEGKDWEDLMTAEQRWGWVTKEHKNGEGEYTFDVRFSTDDALQTPGMAQQVLDAFDEYYNRTFTTRDENGFTTQDSYGQRTRVQYQGDPEGENTQYCDYCDENYDPDWEYHGEEYCPTCGGYYCTSGDPDHESDHPECEQCGESYNQHSQNDTEEHAKPYSYDSYEHFDHSDDDAYYREDTTLSHRPTVNDLAGKIRDYISSIPSAKDNRDALINQMAKNYGMYRKDIAPYVDMALNPFNDQGFSRPEDAAKQHYMEGITQGWQPDAARSQLIGWLMQHYNQQQATELADRAIAETGNQMQLFTKNAWVEQSEAIDRGIHDITDYIVFARLANMRLAGPPNRYDQQAWGTNDLPYDDQDEPYDSIKFPQGDFKRLPDPWESQMPTTPANPQPGQTDAPASSENPYDYQPPDGDNPHAYNPEDLKLMDIEEDPQSLEYRWSYDGHDLHIWQVTNRKMWGPSHYDMFGSEGYDEHSQGRVYVSPQGEVGSLYWQISHPECEDVINQWIEQTFGKPPDTVYRAYGPYKGYKTPRSYFPLVDVYNLPIPKKERWWEIPNARPDGWYYDNGQVPPNKKKRKNVDPYKPINRDPFQLTVPDVQQNTQSQPLDDPQTQSKKDRRRLRRLKNRQKQQGKPNRGRGRGRMGNINMIAWEKSAFDEGDPMVQKFVFTPEGQIHATDGPDHMYAGDIHHGDLWGDMGRMIAQGDFATPNNGFLAHEPVSMHGSDLKPGDVWFWQTPTAQEIQSVKEHFGNVKRVRWYGLGDGTDSF